MAENRLDVEGLTLWRGERLLIADLSFALNAGEALHLAGANGAGKTSLLRALAGLLAAEGRFLWSGEAFDPRSESHRARLVHIGHQDGVKSALTAMAHLSFWAALRERPGDIEAALAAFDLANFADFPGQYLSAGQKKRLSLARLALGPAALWLLDEPLTALDAQSRDRFLRHLAEHRQAGGMAIIASHEPIGAANPRLLDLAANEAA